MDNLRSIDEYLKSVLSTTPELKQMAAEPSRMLQRGLRQRAIIIPPEVVSPSRADATSSTPTPAVLPSTARELKRGTEVLASWEGGELAKEDIPSVEAVILLVGRPALPIQDDDFPPPPELWEILDFQRDTIRPNLRSVGRIEVAMRGDTFMVGTGFMVGNGVIMTNRHVAETFIEKVGSSFKFKDGVIPQIDFRREGGSTQKKVFKIDSVIDVHTHRDIDLALLRIGAAVTEPGAQPPPALPVASEPPQDEDEIEDKRTIYTVGYPATDNAGTTPITVLRDIFGSIVRIKRLAPGHLMRLTPDKKQFKHDCSTLGGNSGSPIFEIGSNRVVGLHFQGVFRDSNDAVAMWTLVDDPIVRDMVNFD